ncbi:GerAB/ArcD/ProY family transporter [Robertmurraya korlensis]|uniref:GerAB/ArcD/ProY family transporter n=1 Tax=Robertmurraya korlensis TaxID=519977 RepID=UPI000824D2F0|nr:GerAB/ArcD/ProY family transporter [Robertmurraya korlensis]
MKVQISNGMFFALIINMIYAKAIGVTQGSMAREIGGDIWISTLIATVQGTVIMSLVIFVIRRMPEGDLIDQSERLFGKWFGKFVALITFIFFLAAFGPIMSTFIFHLKDYFLPEAPILLFICAAFLIGTYAIFFGLEVIARMALIGVFSIIALNILLMLGTLPEFDIRELRPTFQMGFIKTVWASRHHNADWAMATIMAGIILPMVGDKKSWGKMGFAGIAYGMVFVIMWPILEAGVLSPETAAQYIVSCMQMARSAQIGYFVHRYEMIMVAFFALSMLTQIMMSLLCASVAMQKILGLKDYRKVIIPTALILSTFGYWINFNKNRAVDFLEGWWVYISVGVAVVLPMMILVLGFFFKKKLKKKIVAEEAK